MAQPENVPAVAQPENVPAVAQPEIVRYEQNENTSFFCCRGCRTPIALRQELIYQYPSGDAGLFDSVVNVVYGNVFPMFTSQHMEPFSCIKCGLTLGSKFVALMFQTAAIRPGRHMIEMKKVLFWTGKMMVYGDRRNRFKMNEVNAMN